MTLYSPHLAHLPSKLSSLSVRTPYSLITVWTRGSLHFASFQAELACIRVALISPERQIEQLFPQRNNVSLAYHYILLVRTFNNEPSSLLNITEISQQVL